MLQTPAEPPSASKLRASQTVGFMSSSISISVPSPSKQVFILLLCVAMCFSFFLLRHLCQCYEFKQERVYCVLSHQEANSATFHKVSLSNNNIPALVCLQIVKTALKPLSYKLFLDELHLYHGHFSALPLTIL